MNDTEPSPPPENDVEMNLSMEQELSLEQRMCDAVEGINRRIDMIEADNTMCLHALHALAQVLQAKKVEDELGSYIEERGKTIRKIRETLVPPRVDDETTNPGLNG